MKDPLQGDRVEDHLPASAPDTMPFKMTSTTFSVQGKAVLDPASGCHAKIRPRLTRPAAAINSVGMTCAACSASIEGGLKGQPGIFSVVVALL